MWLLAGSVVACGPATEDGADAFARTDSAGVEIAWSRAPAWGSASAWSVSERPTVVIGARGDVDPAQALHRVGAVTRLSGDRIAVANRGTQQIRIYDSAGRHLQDIGRAGDGPGEFRGLAGLWPLPGDSLLAADGGSGRVTLFDPEGELVRTVTPEPVEGALERWARRPFEDGTLLIEARRVSAERRHSGLWARGPWAYDRHAADGPWLNTIAMQPAGMNWSWNVQGSESYTSAPFSWFWPRRASDGQGLWEGDGGRAEVRYVAADGTLRRIVRWAEEARVVTTDVEARYRDFRLAAAGSRYRASTEAMLDGLVFPETMPVYRSLLVDSEGCLWVERYRPDWETTARWWVFDPGGRWLGEPALPRGLTLREVGSDYLLGIVRDVNDVEHVVRYALER